MSAARSREANGGGSQRGAAFVGSSRVCVAAGSALAAVAAGSALAGGAAGSARVCVAASSACSNVAIVRWSSTSLRSSSPSVPRIRSSITGKRSGRYDAETAAFPRTSTAI